MATHRPALVLDIATGTADMAIEAVSIAADKIIGVDIAEQMLAIGRKKIAAKGLSHKIELLRADSENLPFSDSQFDGVMVAFGVRNFEDLHKGLQEMHRVLKPGGMLLILEFSKPRVFPVKQLYYAYFHYVCPLVGTWFSHDAQAYRYLPESVDSFPDGNNFLAILKQAGFRQTRCIPLTFGIASVYLGYKEQ